MKLIQVPPQVLNDVWRAVEPYLKKACDYSRGTYDVPSTRKAIEDKSAQLWVIVEDEKPHHIRAAGTTSLMTFRNGTSAAVIELLGGEDMKEWFSLKSEIENWAKAEGCKTIFCWARKGWTKHLPDYQLTHYVLSKEIS